MFRLMFVASFAFLSGCELPRDPQGTLARVRGNVLRVGVIHEPPWAYTQKDESIGGVEALLASALAKELGAVVRWYPGSQQSLLKALEQSELDLVVGGLTRDIPALDRVALSRCFFRTRVIAAGPMDQLPVKSISGRTAAVRRHDPAMAALARRHGGNPLEAGDPARLNTLVVAEAWRIPSWGLSPTDLVLQTREHVMAAPAGENGWLVYLDCFLKQRETQVWELLQAEFANLQAELKP